MEDSAAEQIKPPPKKGEGFPQILHDRSRAAGMELHRLLVSLSTGTLAIYFLALTGEAKPPLTPHQKLAAITSIFCVAFSAAFGILSMYADVRRFYFWASALQASDKNEKRTFYKERDTWIARDRILAPAMGTLFMIGMLSSLVYGALRIAGK
jgi:hypothetical protein